MPITSQTLAQYKHGDICVETGYWAGAGVQAALDAGFAEVVSIELDPTQVREAREKFALAPVTIVEGDTSVRLRDVIARIDEPITFWLDAHPGDSSPVLDELAIIAEHSIKTHTILIDDRRLMGREWSDVHEQWVLNALLKINEGYVISYADGFIPGDIIVAQVPR